MDKLWIYILVVVIIVLAISILLYRQKGVILEGKVVSKNICRADFSTSHVIVEMPSGEKVELVFDNIASIVCKHQFGEKCFHGKGELLDNNIAVGDLLRVRTERSVSSVRDVRQFISSGKNTGIF